MIARQIHKGLGLFCLLWFCFSAGTVNAQTPDSIKLKLIAEATGNFVILRWSPLDVTSWEWGIEHGYVLERITMSGPDGLFNNADKIASHTIISDPILPIPESEWESLAANDDMAGVAAGAVYGEGFMVDTLSSSDLMSAYNVNQEQENRFGFSLFAADQAFYIAEALGLGYLDQSVVAGYEYAYRITPKDAPTSTIVQNGTVLIDPGNVEALPAPTGIAAIPGDGTVSVSWTKEGTAEKYTSFIIERSSDNGATFQKVNENPVIFTTPANVQTDQLMFMDSLETNGELYIYRVKGVTPFGLEGPESDTIHVIGKPNPLPTRPSIQMINEDTEGIMTIRWDFPTSFESDIDGFDIYRAAKRQGAYEKINNAVLPVNQREHFDNDPLPTNYYMIKALDVNGYELESYASMGQLADETPPDPPVGLNGESSPDGVVKLYWTPNSEDDLLGYKVYVSNQDAGEFLQVTTSIVKDTVFFHPINIQTLSENIYFKVKALDFRENRSEFSQSVQVERPDIIPPSPPSVTQFEARMSGIDLTWIESSSDDVVKHQLQRKAMHEATWETLYDSSSGGTATTHFLDETASYKYMYQYRVLAIDEADLVGSSKIMNIQPLDNGIRPEIASIDAGIEVITIDLDDDTGSPVLTSSTGATVDITMISGQIYGYNINTTGTQQQAPAIGTVKVRWEYFEDAIECGLHSFQVYRSKNDEPMRAFKTIFPDSGALSASGGFIMFGMLDAEVQNDNTYHYQVMAKYIDGAYSPMSDEVSVIYD